MKNPTLKELNASLTSLDLAVIKQLGHNKLTKEALQTLEDVANHGTDTGFNGFTYYSDTVAFFDANKRDIMELVKDMAESLGEEPIAMVKGFKCLGGLGDEVDSFFLQLDENDTSVKNALAWFALEEVARKLANA